MSTITGTTINSGITLSTSGSYTSPLTIASDGAVEVSSGDAIYGTNTQAWTIVNQGTVSASSGYGVRLNGAGYIGNATGALIAGNRATAAGLDANGAGTVVNSGTIIGTADAIFFNAGGYVNNSGGLIQGSDRGIYMRQGLDTVVNSGTITGTSVSNGIGVKLRDANSTLVNAGTISGAGGTAVFFAAGGNLVAVDPGAVFNGIVNGGTGAGNVLELTSAASAGVASGIGTEFVGFSLVTVDSSAHWIFAGSNTIGGGVTLANLGTVSAISGNAVYGSSGTVVNGNSASTTALIAGGNGAIGSPGYSYGGSGGSGGAGVVMTGGGSIGNSGTVRGGNGGYGGDATSVIGTGGTGGAGGAGIDLSGGGSVTNSGLVFGGTGGAAGLGTYPGSGGAGGAGIHLSGGGTIRNLGTIFGGAGGVGDPAGLNGNGIVLSAGGVVTNGSLGTAGALISGRIGVAAYGAGATIVDYGTIVGSDGIAIALGGTGSNLLALGFGYWLIGAVVGSAAVGASNTLALAGTTGATVTVNYDPLTLTNFTDVLFGSGGNNRLAVGYVDFTLPLVISGFTLSSDVIDLQQIGTDGTISNFDTVSDEITVTGSAGSVTLRFDSIDGLTFATQSDLGTGINLAPVCYCRGTLILTERGEVAVEELAIGDLVMTISGETKPVKWVGYRAYDGRFVAGNRAMLPVRIAAGALADGVPVRDLCVSPGHALLVAGMLVRAEHLLNGATITQEEAVERIEYFHVELEAHEIIIADGAPAESYIDCDNRGKFHNAGEFARLYPDDDQPRWQYCRPLLDWDSPEPDAIREALLARAERLGHQVDRDPDLHLVVDGAVIRPETVEGRVYRFAIPSGSAAALLASRSVVPAEVEPSTRDRRRLGVPVERLVLADGDLRIEAGHGHEGLAAGFHDDEATHRWTDGLASLPETWLRSFPGAFMLEVRLLPSSLPYRLPTPARTRAAA